MPTLTDLIRRAYALGASDLHIEPGLPPAFRVEGTLRVQQGPLTPTQTREMAYGVIGSEGPARLRDHGSVDLSRVIGGVRCRINALRSRRGVGLAIRLLAGHTVTLKSLNLHPSLASLSRARSGLVLVCGATGSGKSTTIAGLVQEINATRPAHIVTLEQPVEHWIRPQRAFVRQREVGLDTPSFEQGLLDALREDPDVLVVAEMRRRETMQLTLSAAETGHLVFATVHSGTCAEALHRIVGSFPAEEQNAVQARLAESLVAVVAQKLVLYPEHGLRVPECEILRNSTAARSAIRSGHFHKLGHALELGAEDGSFTFARYVDWLKQRDPFFQPPRKRPSAEEPEVEAPREGQEAAVPRKTAPRATPQPSAERGVFVLDEEPADARSILSELLGS